VRGVEFDLAWMKEVEIGLFATCGNWMLRESMTRSDLEK
jgi:hypothetical protein